MTFREELIITLIDKGLVGIALAGGGYLLSRALERFKGERALENEFAKQRVMKIAEVWAAFYKCEEELTRHSGYVAMAIHGATDDELSLRMEPYHDRGVALITKIRELPQLVSSNRFWLGDAVCDRFDGYLQLLHGQAGTLLDFPRMAKPADELLKELAASRESIVTWTADIRKI
jgi:hypothetical protein